MRGELSIPHRPAIAPSKTVGFLFLNLPDDATGYAHADAPPPDGNGEHCACNYKGEVSCGKNSVRPSTRRCCGLSRALQPGLSSQLPSVVWRMVNFLCHSTARSSPWSRRWFPDLQSLDLVRSSGPRAFGTAS